jgi:hypothetical protein
MFIVLKQFFISVCMIVYMVNDIRLERLSWISHSLEVLVDLKSCALKQNTNINLLVSTIASHYLFS